MLYVSLCLIALLAVLVVAFANILHAQSRAHARREDLLLNQLLHAVDKPWLPPPVSYDDQALQFEIERQALAARAEYPDRSDWTTQPEQEP